MASRMERYYNGEERSKKNQSLYDQINALGNYTNIEGVVDISNSNEINIDSIKKLIDDSNHSEVKVTAIKTTEPPKKKEDEKNYDLRDVLDKAKTQHSESDIKYRNLKRRQYQVLKQLKEENPENEEIDQLLNTLALGGTIDDDLGIFDHLKSDTIVGEEAASIKKVLDEAKEENYNENDTEELETTKTDLSGLDKSFYTASFNFSEKDFEDLKSLDNNLKKNNKLIKILIVVFSISIAIFLLYLIGKIIF